MQHCFTKYLRNSVEWCSLENLYIDGYKPSLKTMKGL